MVREKRKRKKKSHVLYEQCQNGELDSSNSKNIRPQHCTATCWLLQHQHHKHMAFKKVQGFFVFNK